MLTRKRWDDIFELRAAKVLASKVEMKNRIAGAFSTLMQNPTAAAEVSEKGLAPIGGAVINPKTILKSSIDDITIILISLINYG